MPKVSVNIPVYNGEKTIARAVLSILSQDFKDFELIVVDDASTDGTPRVLAGFTDPRLKVVRHERNQGISPARNSALRASSGDYIMVLDADDIALPGRMSRQVRALDEEPALDGVFGWCELFTDNPAEVVSCFSPRVDPAAMRELILFQNPFYHSSACLRRAALGDGYREDLDCAEDYAKWLELIFSGKRLAVLREPLIKYWVHNSTHYSWAKMRANIKSLQARCFREIFGKELTDDEGETQLTLYGLMERLPASRPEAIEALAKVERWIAELGALTPRQPGILTRHMVDHARVQLYLLISHLAPIVGLGVVRFTRKYSPRKRLKLLAKSQLPMAPHGAQFQMNSAHADGAAEPEGAFEAAKRPGTLKVMKRATLGLLRSSGVSGAVGGSAWRRRRLLILAYHSIPLADEHLWHGAQFMQAHVFRARMQLLKAYGCSVLPLDEAVSRLQADTLPEKAVVITFDDGTVDFYTRAFPVLQEFNFPVTLYLTTFYSHYNRPVFDLMSSYLMWKARDRVLDLSKLLGRGPAIDLRAERSRQTAWSELADFAREHKLKAPQKDDLLAALAGQLELDYDSLLRQRFLHNVSDEEVRELAAKGVDIQLHSHRHRTPVDRSLFLREIEDNRQSIRRLTGRDPSHYCYPSGVTNPLFLPWLKEAGVVSATTCESGLASRADDPLLLPRMLDTATLSSVEFGGWLTGVSAALPQRAAQSKELPGV